MPTTDFAEYLATNRAALVALARSCGARSSAEDAVHDAVASWLDRPWDAEAFVATVRKAARANPARPVGPDAPPARAARPYLRRTDAPLPPAVSPPSDAPEAPPPPPSDLLFGPLSPRNRTENARAALIAACDDVLEALDVPAVENADPSGRHDRFWTFTNAGRWQALHARVAAVEAPRVARAYATADASIIFEALLAARRRGFPAQDVPRLVADRLGRVPGTPLAWALLEMEAGLGWKGGPEWERARADVWKKRLARLRIGRATKERSSSPEAKGDTDAKRAV